MAGATQIIGAAAGVLFNTSTGVRSNCTPAAILEFPNGLFSREERRHGAAVLHAAGAIYLLLLTAHACEKYLVPSVKILCRRLKLPEAVSGATLLAAATSSPELFVTGVGTLVTRSDMGVGTVLGSAIFNILAVPACCGLLAGQVVQLQWIPVTRECLVYALSAVMLVAVLWNGEVAWYESLPMLIIYFLYVGGMCCSKQLTTLWYSCQSEESQALLPPAQHDVLCKDIEEETEDRTSSCFLLWPIHKILSWTIPNCRSPQWKSWYPLTLTMAMIWIAVASYLLGWVITVLGDTLTIPDSVMGLTFLAAGTSLPEAISSIIVTKQGYGSMGISNSIGSNTFNILLCLGLPWLVRALWDGEPVVIRSSGLLYSAISLLSTLALLYGAFVATHFTLNRTVGITALFAYIIFLILSLLTELNVFFPVNPPTCEIEK